MWHAVRPEDASKRVESLVTSELQIVRPLLEEAIEKFRFGTAGFILRHYASKAPPNQTLLKHLADIYENIHIVLGAPDQNFSAVRALSIPTLAAGVEFSEIERHHYDKEAARFKSAVSTIEDTPSWRAAGYLLKSYYGLANGSNFGAIASFAKALGENSSSFATPFLGAEDISLQIRNYISASLASAESSQRPTVNFSFYMEYERARVWVRDELNIDIYEIQRSISPRFRFGE